MSELPKLKLNGLCGFPSSTPSAPNSKRTDGAPVPEELELLLEEELLLLELDDEELLLEELELLEELDELELLLEELELELLEELDELELLLDDELDDELLDDELELLLDEELLPVPAPT